MEVLEFEIPKIICKLEKIFPPSFFDSVEHLPIHLGYEAPLASPVQFWWIYPFERYLKHLKNNVQNKAKVEGSMCNAYLVKEVTSFCSTTLKITSLCCMKKWNETSMVVSGPHRILWSISHFSLILVDPYASGGRGA
ncbi:hypothetical protein Syun_007012 [Stephania yunnanensis]|uniref:DUF4218 domain-containing protein n=1 Tax=Stephania yunnanensis TaxID=152371 RepID=A0AAP0KXU9_9MAGN